MKKLKDRDKQYLPRCMINELIQSITVKVHCVDRNLLLLLQVWSLFFLHASHESSLSYLNLIIDKKKYSWSLQSTLLRNHLFSFSFFFFEWIIYTAFILFGFIIENSKINWDPLKSNEIHWDQLKSNEIHWDRMRSRIFLKRQQKNNRTFQPLKKRWEIFLLLL